MHEVLAVLLWRRPGDSLQGVQGTDGSASLCSGSERRTDKLTRETAWSCGISRSRPLLYTLLLVLFFASFPPQLSESSIRLRRRGAATSAQNSFEKKEDEFPVLRSLRALSAEMDAFERLDILLAESEAFPLFPHQFPQRIRSLLQ